MFGGLRIYPFADCYLFVDIWVTLMFVFKADWMTPTPTMLESCSLSFWNLSSFLKSFFLKLVICIVDLPVAKIVFFYSPKCNRFALAPLAFDHGIVTESSTELIGYWFVFYWDFLISTVVADDSLTFFPFWYCCS